MNYIATTTKPTIASARQAVNAAMTAWSKAGATLKRSLATLIELEGKQRIKGALKDFEV